MADDNDGKGQGRCVHVEVALGLRRDGGVDVLKADATSHSCEGGTCSRGPSAVATDAYRDGWDRIFGGRNRANDAGAN